ncbi:MAG: hypothetical protein H7A35_13240 [Planctomycetales bacterium]|nr:MAG: hypothetical protein H7A35_13240 [Planctomycetales bacterium]
MEVISMKVFGLLVYSLTIVSLIYAIGSAQVIERMACFIRNHAGFPFDEGVNDEMVFQRQRLDALFLLVAFCTVAGIVGSAPLPFVQHDLLNVCVAMATTTLICIGLWARMYRFNATLQEDFRLHFRNWDDPDEEDKGVGT